MGKWEKTRGCCCWSCVVVEDFPPLLLLLVTTNCRIRSVKTAISLFCASVALVAFPPFFGMILCFFDEETFELGICQSGDQKKKKKKRREEKGKEFVDKINEII